MSEAYDALVARSNGAMVVVTASDGREHAGCVVGFHNQCAIEPRQHAVWLSKANHTYRVALHAERLGVHFLTPDDEAVARLFGEQSGDELDKFERVDWSPGPAGTPLLEALPNRFLGRRVALAEVGGDHACFVLEVEDAVGGEFEPLRISALGDLTPGHGVEERPAPAKARTP
ncbi:MAG: flavin reductase family protein [Propionibacteriaceae bacterium]|nr:flavin reductase family protein [Propionibacteriaceae bacterium]